MWGRLAARRPPLLFCSPSSLQSGAYSCILFSQYKTNGGKRDALSFETSVCAHPRGACRRHMVFRVRRPAAILGFFGLFILFVDSVSYGVGLLVIAFLISPYGLPMLATWLLAKLHVLRYAIQDRIYG